ncbi:5-deoxy-glucuronate isomerase [Alkalispirochaeta sphaeroplastigenens]|nr:5-deoxy-glucuronate isomerase [Alkalispirochaeta sphaeroplastigenens]
MAIIRSGARLSAGMNSIIAEDGPYQEMLMDFSILRLAPGEVWTNQDPRERAFLLMTGTVTFAWQEDQETRSVQCTRRNLLDEDPWALHLCAGAEATLTAGPEGVEIALQSVGNTRTFAPRLWKPGEYRSDRFGEGTLQDTSTRTVRTIFDAATAPESGMVLGEVINYPGKWSSYPPHVHAQPEVYHYRFFPAQGFGFSQVGDEVYRVTNGDTVTIDPDVPHPQTAAPGYAMYYIWMIPHLPQDRFGPDSRIFQEEHTWVMNGDAPIWPDAPLTKVLDHQTS